jgi:hypothetical protein
MNRKPLLVNMAPVQDTVPAGKIAPPSRSTAAMPPPIPSRLRGEQLLDLIHVECLQGSSKIVRVANQDRQGFLFFRQGNIVHATQAGRVGEAAVRVILRWDRGSFEVWDAPWPKDESITLPWQKVLLRASQDLTLGPPARGSVELSSAKLDEGGDAAPRVLSFPANTNVAKGDDDLNKPTARPEPPPFHRLPIDVVRVAASGEVLEGASSTDFIERVAYAVQIADLLGELLGAGAFDSLEVAQPNGACLIARDQAGVLVGASTSDPSVDQTALRKRLGLSSERP